MIRLLEIAYSNEPLMRPADAEFGVTIDFVRGESDPVQVFTAMAEMLSAFSEMDRILIGAVAPDAAPITVIEDVEAASITTWIKNKLEKVDDQAIKEFDLKQQIGVYAVKAKYRVLRFLNEREQKEKTQRLQQLQEDLTELAAQSATQLLPPPVNVTALIPSMNQVQAAKARLRNGERVTIKSDREPDCPLDTSSTEPIVGPSETPAPLNEAKGEMELLLLVRKVDFIGKSQWEFRHGKSPILANIEDADWLDRFHKGFERIVPGASLRVTVRYKHDYDGRGMIIDSEYDVVKVHGIVPPSALQQEELFGG